MSRTARNTKIALAALTLVAVSTVSASACGGGGGGRTSGRFAIAYSRNVPHMKSQAPRNNYHQAGNYNNHRYQAAPVVSQPVVQQPVIVQQPQPTVVAAPPQQLIPQQAPVQAAAPPTFQPMAPVATQGAPVPTIDPATQSAEDAALAALAAFGE